MTQVCLVGEPEVDLRMELFSRETSRDALATYTISRPFENSLQVRTVSVGAAVSLLNDLNWYLVRFVSVALVKEPSISEDEWLSRDLAMEVRDGGVRPEETDVYLKVFGLDDGELLEPLFVKRREDGSIPEYDLHDVEETVVVRVSADEYGAT